MVFSVVRAPTVATQRRGKHASITVGELFSTLSVPRQLGRPSQFCTVGYEERTLAREAEESPQLKSVTRKRLVKTRQAGEDLACSDS
jgi:hypothetical protein